MTYYHLQDCVGQQIMVAFVKQIWHPKHSQLMIETGQTSSSGRCPMLVRLSDFIDEFSHVFVRKHPTVSYIGFHELIKHIQKSVISSGNRVTAPVNSSTLISSADLFNSHFFDISPLLLKFCEREHMKRNEKAKV